MKKYLHIGYPKNFSTSLQRNFFSAHDEIFHLGIGLNSNLGYCDPFVSSMFEVYLKTAKSFKYKENEQRMIDHIQGLMEQAEAQGKKAFGASSEHLGFAFTHEILDFETKLTRTKKIFGEGLEIIMLVRNQSGLIKSLYKESVRVGLPGSYEEFVYNLHKFQDRNYVYDFRYDIVYDTLCDMFGKDKVHVMVFEDYRGGDKKMVMEEGKVKLIDSISKALDVSYLEVDFAHYNEALTDSQIIIKSELNKEHRHDLGRELVFSAEIHRQVEYFREELGIHEEEPHTYEDVITKRALIKQAQEASKNNPDQKLSMSCDAKLAAWFKKFYEEGNKAFVQKSGMELPENYFNLKFD